MNFKRKYHGSYSKSAQYVARELEAKSKLLRNLAPVGVEVLDSGLGVETVGIVEGSSEVRFDFTLIDSITGRVIAYVEVTGDAINDIYAYILSEKLVKARLSKYPVWFMYHKRSKRMWRMFSARFVARVGEEVKWLEDEKPYLRVPVSKGLYFAEWIRWLKSHIIPMIRDAKHPSMYDKYLESWRMR